MAHRNPSYCLPVLGEPARSGRNDPVGEPTELPRKSNETKVSFRGIATAGTNQIRIVTTTNTLSSPLFSTSSTQHHRRYRQRSSSASSTQRHRRHLHHRHQSIFISNNTAGEARRSERNGGGRHVSRFLTIQGVGINDVCSTAKSWCIRKR